MHSLKDAQKLAQEWAKAIRAMDAPWHIIAAEVSWGFAEVEKGGNPTIVLEQVRERVELRKKESANVSSSA